LAKILDQASHILPYRRRQMAYDFILAETLDSGSCDES